MRLEKVQFLYCGNFLYLYLIILSRGHTLVAAACLLLTCCLPAAYACLPAAYACCCSLAAAACLLLLACCCLPAAVCMLLLACCCWPAAMCIKVVDSSQEVCPILPAITSWSPTSQKHTHSLSLLVSPARTSRQRQTRRPRLTVIFFFGKMFAPDMAAGNSGPLYLLS